MREAANDQATGLRRLFARDTLQVLSVLGTGEAPAAAVTLDLAAALADLGHRPLIVDLEMGHAAIALGLTPRYELAHVLCGDKKLKDVLLTSSNGVAVLPATRGLEHAAKKGPWKQTLNGLLREAGQSFNVWLLSGLAAPVAECERPLLVVAPTREAITGAYAQIKSLARDHGHRDFRIVVDRAASEAVALEAFTSIAETSRRFLSARLHYCGYLPRSAGERLLKPTGVHAHLATARSPREHAFAQLAEAVFAATPLVRPIAAIAQGR